MKKSNVVILVVVSLVFVCIIGLVCFGVFSLVKPRTALTAEELKNFMENKGYMSVDVKEQFAEVDYIDEAIMVGNEEFLIEFYVISDKEYANNFYANCKYIFESSKGSMSSETNMNFSNGSKYSLTTDGKYKNVTCIENTVLCFDIDEENKEVVKELLKEINY